MGFEGKGSVAGSGSAVVSFLKEQSSRFTRRPRSSGPSELRPGWCHKSDLRFSQWKHYLILSLVDENIHTSKCLKNRCIRKCNYFVEENIPHCCYITINWSYHTDEGPGQWSPTFFKDPWAWPEWRSWSTDLPPVTFRPRLSNLRTLYLGVQHMNYRKLLSHEINQDCN